MSVDEDVNPKLNELKYYPNPTMGVVTLAFSDNSEKKIEVYSCVGELVIYRNNISDRIHKLDMTSLSNGVYYVRVTSNSSTKTYKVSKL